jgi:predicted naringenin-chalcone synthase
MSYITAIGTATPPHKIRQSIICGFMGAMMDLSDTEVRKLRAVFNGSGIEYRHSVLEDYAKTTNFSFYPNSTKEAFPGTEARMALYQQHALPLSVAAVQDLLSARQSFDLSSTTHLVVVSCTGMYAPGLDIELVKALNLSSTVQRTCITFMGCYAAFNACKVADAFCSQDKGAKVLIVCTELCSIHFQQATSEDNILANALFGDGSAAILVEGSTDTKKSISFQTFHSELALAGEKEMAWTIGDAGFEMKLSSYVPDVIRSEIKSLTDSLLRKLNLLKEDVKYFALHPGGKKILETIERQLGLSRTDNIAAYEVLKNYGNMSSPTVVFVLKRLFERLTKEDDDAYILSAAFGPGLTLESMLLQVNIR